ncbi:MAG: carboxypeptidase regulatory-like domain-containing protein, partial [Thermoplasmata archaeon]
SYSIEAVAPGFLSESLFVVVHATVENLNLTLAPSTVLLSGVVRDGLTNNPLQAVSLMETLGGVVTTIAQTDASGSFAVPLGNGTHTITASSAGSLGITYSPVTFTVSINGLPYTHDLLLFPPLTQVYGLVADEVSGVYIANASVTGTGLTSEHIPSQFAISTSGTGTFQLALYAGSYTFTASASGYVTEKTTRSVNGESILSLTLSLAPSPPPSTAGGSVPISGGTLALLGGVAVVAVGAMLVARRLSTSPARSRSSLAVKES